MSPYNNWLVPIVRPSLEQALLSTQGNLFQAAALLGCNVRTLYNWLKKTGIDPDTYRIKILTEQELLAIENKTK